MAQAWRFGSGLRRFLRDPLDPRTALTEMGREVQRRHERFLAVLDATVWPSPTSPYRALLDHAGFDHDAVDALVASAGLDGCLQTLVDEGVYLSYEEVQGIAPVRRGSLVLSVSPTDLANPLHQPDFLAGTSGTRSGGTPVPTSFRSLRRMAANLALTDHVWSVTGAPHALWRPALPASGGVIATLAGSVSGTPPEAWFSPTDPRDRAMATRKRLANDLLPALAWSAGHRIPRPRHVPSHRPGPVLDWCEDRLRSHGRAALNAYPSAAAMLSDAAVDRGLRLDGLVIRMVGEPTTPTKAKAVRASGATPVDGYAFAQLGAAATACPHTDDEELHVFDQDAAVVTRRRNRSDGHAVDALAWTTLSLDARAILLNTENDDEASIHTATCPCPMGALGMRTRLRRVRGLSKSVASGVTLPGDLLHRLIEDVLPRRFGGRPADWQLVESEESAGVTRVDVRADPGLGRLDEHAVRGAILDELRSTDVGSLAAAMWSGPDNLRLLRETPRRTAAGKLLPYHLER